MCASPQCGSVRAMKVAPRVAVFVAALVVPLAAVGFTYGMAGGGDGEPRTTTEIRIGDSGAPGSTPSSSGPAVPTSAPPPTQVPPVPAPPPAPAPAPDPAPGYHPPPEPVVEAPPPVTDQDDHGGDDDGDDERGGNDDGGGDDGGGGDDDGD